MHNVHTNQKSIKKWYSSDTKTDAEWVENDAFISLTELSFPKAGAIEWVSEGMIERNEASEWMSAAERASEPSSAVQANV